MPPGDGIAPHPKSSAEPSRSANAGSMGHRLRRVPIAWLAWFVLVFVVYNAGVDRATSRRVHDAMRAHALESTPQNQLLAARSYFADDGDVTRYYAYCNAALGRPYEGYYIRSMVEWRRSFGLPNPPDDPDGNDSPTWAARPLVPYRDYTVEYPPGFFLFAIPPALFAASASSYRVLFGAFMALLLTLAIVACVRFGRALPTPAIHTAKLVAWSCAATLALGKIGTQRYDAVLSLLVCLMCWACATRRPFLLGTSMGLAIAGKLLPVVIAPLFILYLVRARRPRELLIASLAATSTALLFCIPAALAAGPALLDMLRYHIERPLHIESTAAALLGLMHAIDPSSSFSAGSSSLQVVKTFGSTNVVGGQSGIALALIPWLTAASLGFVYVNTFRRLRGQGEAERNLTLAEGVVCALVVTMIFGKVFSPQYLVWLLPMGVLLSLFRGGWLPSILVAVMLLSQIIFPIVYWAVQRLEPLSCGLILLRNGLLAYWAVRLLRPPPAGPARAGHLQPGPNARAKTPA